MNNLQLAIVWRIYHSGIFIGLGLAACGFAQFTSLDYGLRVFILANGVFAAAAWALISRRLLLEITEPDSRTISEATMEAAKILVHAKERIPLQVNCTDGCASLVHDRLLLRAASGELIHRCSSVETKAFLEKVKSVADSERYDENHLLPGNTISATVSRHDAHIHLPDQRSFSLPVSECRILGVMLRQNLKLANRAS